MLGLYLYTLYNHYKSPNMLRILNKLTLYKGLHIFVKIMCFGQKSKNNNNKTKKTNMKTLAGAWD